MRQRPMGVEDLEATMAVPCLATLLGVRLWERPGGPVPASIAAQRPQGACEQDIATARLWAPHLSPQQ